MKVYLDSEYMAHAEYAEGYNEAEHSFFDVIAPELFDCYRFIPAEHEHDGQQGEYIGLVNPKADMVSIQQAFESELIARLHTAEAELADADAALEELGVTVDE